MVKIDGKYYEDVETVVSSDNIKHTSFSINYKKVVPKLSVMVQTFVDGQPVSFAGIFDTGAESLCVKKSMVPKDLLKLGTVKISGATGAEDAIIYEMHFNLKFDGGRSITFNNMPVVATDLPGNVDFLVGQPVIKLFDSFNVSNFSVLDVEYVNIGK